MRRDSGSGGGVVLYSSLVSVQNAIEEVKWTYVEGILVSLVMGSISESLLEDSRRLWICDGKGRKPRRCALPFKVSSHNGGCS